MPPWAAIRSRGAGCRGSRTTCRRVAGLAERRRGRAASEAGADHDDREPATVGGVGDPRVELAGLPPLLERAARRLGVGDRVARGVVARRVVVLLGAEVVWEESKVFVVSGMSVMAAAPFSR